MKQLAFIAFAFFLVTLFNGCLKDVKLSRYTYYVPEYELKATVQADIKSNAPLPIENPGRIFVKGDYIYVNEKGKGIHVIDYSQPSSPQNIAFIPIPGNGNMSIQGNYLYADEYADLMTIDISDPRNTKLVDTTNNIITENPYIFSYGYGYYAGSNDYVIKSWRKVDTMVKSDDPIRTYYYTSFPGSASPEYYSAADGSKSSSADGIAGSTAQFTVLNNRLYTVSPHYINIFNIENLAKPSFVKTNSYIGKSFETIYPFENYLFLGSNSAMYIFDASDKDNPTEVGSFGHVNVCDPVIAEPGLAYVTLRSGGTCGGTVNELEILNTTDVTNPVLIKSYPFTNPSGLAKDGNLLFICDGSDGLKILDATDVNNITQIKAIAGFVPNDVIATDGIAIVTANDGLYLVDYTKPTAASAISKINIQQ